MSLISFGVSRAITTWGNAEIHLKGDALAARMDLDNPENIPGMPDRVDTSCFRLELEGRWEETLDSVATMERNITLSARKDGGDVDVGTGMELDGQLNYIDAARGMEASVQARTLFGENSYHEWGLGGMLRFAPQGTSSGLSVTLNLDWGTSRNDFGLFLQLQYRPSLLP